MQSAAYLISGHLYRKRRKSCGEAGNMVTRFAFCEGSDLSELC